jgi:2-polyprenyl-3-methyl-5-hydroxy-6-metoxy-1,4-benzoquinol methylase
LYRILYGMPIHYTPFRKSLECTHLNTAVRREIAGTLSRKEWADRNRRVLLGWHARVLRRGREQSQATPDGESVFTYVKLMGELLSRPQRILILGCGGGNLATRLSRLCKSLTFVDINPISFILAHKFFELPTSSAREPARHINSIILCRRTC